MTFLHRIRLTVNGVSTPVDVDVRSTLLDLLRERLSLTGTKKGCDHGLCGACTVEVDTQRVLSCLTLAVSIDGSDIRTVEGLADGDELHPLQRAFVEHDGFQCGYCTPGHLCSARAMLREFDRGDLSGESFNGAVAEVTNGPKSLSDSEVRERMAGNICRCGAHANIVAAIKSVHDAS